MQTPPILLSIWLTCTIGLLTACSANQTSVPQTADSPIAVADSSDVSQATSVSPEAMSTTTSPTASPQPDPEPTPLTPTDETTPVPPTATLEPTLVPPTVTPEPMPEGPLSLREIQIEGLPSPLFLPEGFTINVFARNFPNRPRFMAFSPEGILHVSLPEQGTIVAMPDANDDGQADELRVVAEGLNRPHGIVFHGGAVWVAETGAVLRLTQPDEQGRYQQRETIVSDLPPDGQHWTRTIGFGPDGGLFVSIGSSCNVCLEEDERRATITRYEPDGTNPQIFVSGLRNAVGFIWNPVGELVTTNNERDLMSDDIPPETINIARGGEHFGWPSCHSGNIIDPEFGIYGRCDNVTAPAFKMQAHSAPLGLWFYNGTQFPAFLQGDLFVAFHGSWNRTEPTGYKIVRLRIENNRPVHIEDFITGWLEGDRWGRPVDIVVGSDGSMFISDDGFNVIYRVTYSG